MTTSNGTLVTTSTEKQLVNYAAKLGYAARGLIYLVIGGLAFLAAVTATSGEKTGSKGAIVTLLEQPFGRVIIVVLIAGLLCYSMWRGIQALTDTDDHGTDVKGLTIRGGLAVSSISHLVLAFWTTRLAFGQENASDSSSSSALLDSGAGQILVGFIGVTIIGVGIAHIFKAWTAKFEERMEIPADKKGWINPLCRFGLFSRGIVWCLIGWFTLYSAFMVQDGEIKGLRDALEYLQQQAYGTWLLSVAGLGLASFGLYSTFEAFYRRINYDND